MRLVVYGEGWLATGESEEVVSWEWRWMRLERPCFPTKEERWELLFSWSQICRRINHSCPRCAFLKSLALASGFSWTSRMFLTDTNLTNVIHNSFHNRSLQHLVSSYFFVANLWKLQDPELVFLFTTWPLDGVPEPVSFLTSRQQES